MAAVFMSTFRISTCHSGPTGGVESVLAARGRIEVQDDVAAAESAWSRCIIIIGALFGNAIIGRCASRNAGGTE
jgi:hypothetical protein